MSELVILASQTMRRVSRTRPHKLVIVRNQHLDLPFICRFGFTVGEVPCRPWCIFP